MHRPFLYYITDRSQFPGDETTRRRRLLEKISEAARVGVDYIQLREKDLPARALEELARDAVCVLEDEKRRAANREQRTAFLINCRTDVAISRAEKGSWPCSCSRRVSSSCIRPCTLAVSAGSEG